MKKRLLMLLSMFMAITSVGWMQAENIVWTVDAARTDADTQTAFKTLKAAVQAADSLKGTDKLVISVAPGDYNIERTDATVGNGNYLAITRDNVEIVGGGTDNSGVKIYSSTEAVNGNWVDQNLITIHGNNVKIQNVTITCKKQVNKVIEVLGDSVTLNNLVFNAPQGEKFAGSIYFNSPTDDADKNIGTVTLKNLVLNNGRITFTGAEKGTVNMEGIQLYYNEMAITDASMDDLQKYTPFGAIANKPDLTLNVGESVNVYLKCSESSYKLDAATVANMPAGSSLNLLGQGEYVLTSQLVIDKPMLLKGELDTSGNPVATITATGDWNVDGSKKNLISIEGDAEGTAKLQNLCIKGSKGSGINAQSKMQMILENVVLENNTNAGLLVHGGVYATNLHTKGNGWGGVNVDKGTPEYPRSFTFNEQSTFAETVKIWAEKKNADTPAKLVLCPEDQNWRWFEGKGGEDNAVDMYFWTNIGMEVEVANADELKSAITSAIPGQTIILTGSAYGSADSIQSFGSIKVANVTIKAKDLSAKPKVYGTFKILAEGCTIDGLDMYTKSDGSAALKNIIDVVAMSATITNNTFNMGEPTTGNVSNGLCIWPYGTEEKPSYVVKSNEFKGFKAIVTEWSSTAFSLVEGLELSRFGLSSDQKSKAVTIENESNFWTENKFEGCYSDYVHSNWEKTDNSEAAAPLYSFAAVSSNDDALETAVNYSGDDAKVYAKGTYTLTKQLAIKKSISIYGVIADGDTTAISAASAGTWTECSDKNDSTLLHIESAKNVSLNNLNIRNSQRNGINIYASTGVTLNNVSVSNSKAAGLIVNGSTVTAINFRTSGNGWYGVNVDKGANVSVDPVFTIGTGCSFDEPIAILSDVADAPAGYVIGNGWFKTKQGNVSVWINGATSGLNFAITSVPSSVIYGQATLPLLTNVDSAYYKAEKGVKISILGNNSDIVEIKEIEGQPDSLLIKKPGEAVLVLAVGDTTITQPLTVLKKTLTITGITATTKDYNGNKEVTLVTTDMKVNGLVGDHKDVVTVTEQGEALSANAGVQPVKVIASLKNNGTDYGEYYELAEITGVMDTIKKVDLTVTATVSTTANTNTNDTLTVDYGTLPEFKVTYGTFVNSENSNVLNGSLKYNSSATTTSLAGTYSVTPSGLTADNYNIKYVSAPFKIRAIAPTVEMTGIEVVSLGGQSQNKASVKVSGHVTSNGGTKTTDLVGTFKVKTNNSYEDKNLSLAVDKEGFFSATLEGLSNAETYILASAKAGSLVSADGADNGKAMSVNLALKLQNVSFASTFKALTYGIDPILLTANDFEAGAKVTFTSGNPEIITIQDSNKMVVKKPGVTTITVTAEKSEYITAIAKQTITVNKKALAVTPKAITKVYDGTTAVTVTGELPKLESLQTATLANTNINANFANKNVGSSSVKLAGEFTLSAGSEYYELIQPTNLTGTITSGGDVTVVVSNVSRNYNEKALHYDLKFMVGDKELVSPAYTGTISVKEETSGTYTVVPNIAIPNYGKVTVDPASGSIDIKKGTPKVLTYNVDASNIGGLLVDAEGWTDAHVRVIGENDSKAHASVYYNGDKDSIVGRSLPNATPPTIEWKFNVVQPATYNRMMKATKAAIASQSVTYGQTATFAKQTNVTFESSNPNVFVVKESNSGMMIETVGVGTAAIIAKGSGNGSTGITCLQVTVDPKPITLEAEAITKVYDGTTAVNVSLKPVELIGATLDLTGVSFNFAQSNTGDNLTVTPSKDIVLKNDNDALASAANYTLKVSGLQGSITKRELTFTGTEVNKYYDGTNTVTLTDYAATGLIDGEAIPALTATFTSATQSATNVATGLDVALKLVNENGNYTLAGATGLKGNIVKSTLDAVLPDGASSDTRLIEKVALTVRETGVKIGTNASINYAPTVSHEGSGNNTVYYISGGDNDNYSVVYDKNQIGFKSETNPPSGGGDVEETVTISLDATTKVLPRLEEFVLKATVSPSGKTVTWSSSDPTVASVTADGNKATVKGLKVGTATITAKIGDVTAACEVTVDFATGLEEALANTEVFGRKGNIYVNPLQPLQVTVVNMIGKVVYNARISGNTQIPVTKGIYIVKLTNAGNTNVTKVSVY